MPTPNSGIDYWIGSDPVSRATFNNKLTELDAKLSSDDHNHSGAPFGGTSLGPLVKVDTTDATAPAAPGSGLTRVYSISSRVGYRAGAAGTAKVLADQDTAETLSNKTLTAPVIADFTNAQHDHTSASEGGGLTGFNGITSGPTMDLNYLMMMMGG